MRVLAVDTTTPRGSLAVVGPEGLLAEVRVTTAQGHSRWLLPAVDAVLRGLAVLPQDLDAFAVTTGPGSFTGQRVGLSSVQGLALASGKPCVPVSALDVLLSSLDGAPIVVALMDAFRGEVYSAVSEGGQRRPEGPRVGSLEGALAGLPAGAAFVGDAVDGLRSRIEAAANDPRFPPVDLFLAARLGRLALEQVARGEVIAARDLRPLYLRGAEIGRQAR